MVKKCPSCGYNNRDDAGFCSSCGASLAGAAAPALKPVPSVRVVTPVTSGSPIRVPAPGQCYLPSKSSSNLRLQSMWKINLPRRFQSVHGLSTLPTMLPRSSANDSGSARPTRLTRLTRFPGSTRHARFAGFAQARQVHQVHREDSHQCQWRCQC